MCGACFGVGLGFLLALRWEVRSTPAFLLVLAVTAIVAAVGALRFGDRFWHWLGGNHGRW